MNWTAPATQGIYQIMVRATDDEGLFAQATTTILVKNFNPAPGNLIAHYPFTGNADDVSGNALHGQSNGALLVPDQNGIPQSAYYFNGGAQHILVANSPLLNFQDAITVSSWFKANALPEKETFLLSHGSWQNRWKVSVTPEKYLRWTVNTLSGVADLDAAVPLETEIFYHVAVSYDGALLALYLNGELSSYKTLSGKIRTTALPFLMGQMIPGDANYNFKGVMDAVKIFNYALTPGAVNGLYQQGVTSVETPGSADAGQLVLSPNPVSEILTVRVNSDWATQSHSAHNLVQVRDLTGRLVLERVTNSTDRVDLDLKNCKPGIYTVIFISGEARLAARFVKI